MPFLDREFKKLVDNIADPDDRDLARAMGILLAAIFAGPRSERLVDATGEQHEFVQAIAGRMQQAGLWTTSVDDRECWTDDGELNGEGLFAHALVALGRTRREATPIGATYFDLRTNKVTREWRIRCSVH